MKKTVIDHLQELRKRLIIILVSFTIFFIIGFFFSNYIIELIKQLVISYDIKLIVTKPLDFLYTQIKIGLFVSLFLTLPLIVYHLIKFLKPGMAKKENKIIKRLIPLSIILSILGLGFSYIILSKFAIGFLSGLAIKSGIENLWNLNSFITFLFTSSLALILVFQIPIIILGLNKLNIVSLEELRKQRKYIIVLMFILAALITPPDIMTQVLIAIPLVFMYEFSLLIIKIWK